MLHKLGLLLMVPVLALASAAWAADFGTAAEAKAMLEKAVAAIKKDEAAALAMFTKGEGGFKEKDLYVFCGDATSGLFTAHINAALIGKSLKELKDKAGKPIGEEMYKEAAAGKIEEVDYMWPRPGETEPVKKVTYFTKAGNQICGVGYYPK